MISERKLPKKYWNWHEIARSLRPSKVRPKTKNVFRWASSSCGPPATFALPHPRRPQHHAGLVGCREQRSEARARRRALRREGPLCAILHRVDAMVPHTRGEAGRQEPKEVGSGRLVVEGAGADHQAASRDGRRAAGREGDHWVQAQPHDNGRSRPRHRVAAAQGQGERAAVHGDGEQGARRPAPEHQGLPRRGQRHHGWLSGSRAARARQDWQLPARLGARTARRALQVR